MDGSRFDDLTRVLAGSVSRRSVLRGALAASFGLALGQRAAAACPPAQVHRRGSGCICKATGWPPDANGQCPCPNGQIRCGDLCIDPATDKANCGGCASACPTPTDPCRVAVCRNGVCRTKAGKDGTPCDDGDPATVNDVCTNGVCAGTPVGCTGCDIGDTCVAAGTLHPTNPCQVCDPAANAGGWSNFADGYPCDDGNACTRYDYCQAGVCTGSDPVVCAAAPDQCHEAGVCNPATGGCTYAPKPDGTACDDGDACTQTDTCQAGVCVGSDPVVCTAPDACHYSICISSTGVCSSPEPTVDFEHDPHNCGSCGYDCAFWETCSAGTCSSDGLCQAGMDAFGPGSAAVICGATSTDLACYCTTDIQGNPVCTSPVGGCYPCSSNADCRGGPDWVCTQAPWCANSSLPDLRTACRAPCV